MRIKPDWILFSVHSTKFRVFQFKEIFPKELRKEVKAVTRDSGILTINGIINLYSIDEESMLLTVQSVSGILSIMKD